MRRDEVGKCPESSSGGHLWILVTTKELASQGLDEYICQNCRKQAAEPTTA